jgi:hypothetical protein
MNKFIAVGILLALGCVIFLHVAGPDASLGEAAESVMQAGTDAIEAKKIP